MPADAPQLPVAGLSSPARPEGYPGAQLLRLDRIRLDGGTQPRVRPNPEVIAEYAGDIAEGAAFPPVTVFLDQEGNHWLADGFHRWEAHQQAGFDELWCEIHSGDLRAAVLYSVGANAVHGLRLTNEDKRRAVRRLLNDQEWGRWSDREIARRARVSDRLVNTIRAAIAKEPVTQEATIANNSQSGRLVRRQDGTEYTYPDRKPQPAAPTERHTTPYRAEKPLRDIYEPEVERPPETETLDGQRRAKIAAAVVACRGLPSAEAKVLALLPDDLTLEEAQAAAHWWRTLHALMAGHA